jgi:hypothetical protein
MIGQRECGKDVRGGLVLCLYVGQLELTGRTNQRGDNHGEI